MNQAVSRDKYEKIKIKAIKWRDKAIEGENIISNLYKEIKELHLRVDNRSNEMDNFIEIEHENNELRKELKSLTTKLSKTDFELERQMMRKDSEIDRLKAYLEDVKERYREVREDNKELRQGHRKIS